MVEISALRCYNPDKLGTVSGDGVVWLNGIPFNQWLCPICRVKPLRFQPSINGLYLVSVNSVVSFDVFVERVMRTRDRLARLPRPSGRLDSADSWPDRFPSSSGIKEVLDASFYASLEQYEGRPLRAVLKWTHPVFGRSYVHELPSPSRDLSQRTLRQLAQVADGMTTELGLVLDGNRLAVSGVEICWPGRGAFENDGFTAGVKISIKGPGHIEYQEGGIAFAYRKGRHYRMRPLQTNASVRSWIEDAQKALIERATSSLKSDETWGKHEEEPQFPEHIMLSFLCSVLRTMENVGHGGTLIVLPSADDASHIDIRFPASSSDLDTLVRRFGEASLLIASQGVYAVSPFTPTVADKNIIMSKIQSYAVAFASLANCDGAVVLTRDAQLLGFGGIIQTPVAARQNDRQLARGARHTSAQWLCESVSGAIALVVSADGGITVIYGNNGVADVSADLVVW